MSWEPINKPRGGWAVAPNLLDYERACAAFSWAEAARFTPGVRSLEDQLQIVHPA
jgi:hypothetical protein